MLQYKEFSAHALDATCLARTSWSSYGSTVLYITHVQYGVFHPEVRLEPKQAMTIGGILGSSHSVYRISITKSPNALQPKARFWTVWQSLDTLKSSSRRQPTGDHTSSPLKWAWTILSTSWHKCSALYGLVPLRSTELWQFWTGDQFLQMERTKRQ